MLDEYIINTIKEDCEDVVIFINDEYKKAIRGKKVFWIGPYASKITLLGDDWYDTLGDNSAYNYQELVDKIDKLEE